MAQTTAQRTVQLRQAQNDLRQLARKYSLVKQRGGLVPDWVPERVTELKAEIKELSAPVTTADPLAHCAFCKRPTGGPLDGCSEPNCQRREIEMEAEFKRSEDQ